MDGRIELTVVRAHSGTGLVRSDDVHYTVIFIKKRIRIARNGLQTKNPRQHDADRTVTYLPDVHTRVRVV